MDNTTKTNIEIIRTPEKETVCLACKGKATIFWEARNDLDPIGDWVVYDQFQCNSCGTEGEECDVASSREDAIAKATALAAAFALPDFSCDEDEDEY